MRNLLRSRTESLFDKDIKSIGILPSICEALNNYNDLFNYFEIWFNCSTFPTYSNWKSIVKTKVRDLESRFWLDFCSGHPNMHAAQACFEYVSPSKFWSLADLCWQKYLARPSKRTSTAFSLVFKTTTVGVSQQQGWAALPIFIFWITTVNHTSTRPCNEYCVTWTVFTDS